MPLERITVFCFAASYALALLLECTHFFIPRARLRLLSNICGAAGLLAHTLFLAVQRPPLASQQGFFLFLAWILAVFYLYGTVHHRRLAWSVFVLPLVLGLTVLAAIFQAGDSTSAADAAMPVDPAEFWRLTHVGLFILAAVGICVAFVASVMYLVQARRLKKKVHPRHGLKLPSLERLENMNRRAINLAFPLLTAGLALGSALLVQDDRAALSWSDPRVISTFLLWILFAVLLYLRYGFHLRGRSVALLTVAAFGLLVVTLVTSHAGGAGR